MPSALNLVSGHYFDRASGGRVLTPAGRPGSTGENEMVEHQGIAPCIPVWKTGVYLSTLMLEKIGVP